MALSIHVRLHELSFASLRDYLADAVADPRKARVGLEEAKNGALLERFSDSEHHLLRELYTDVFANHVHGG